MPKSRSISIIQAPSLLSGFNQSVRFRLAGLECRQYGVMIRIIDLVCRKHLCYVRYDTKCWRRFWSFSELIQSTFG
jgi:hypothetical protein